LTCTRRGTGYATLLTSTVTESRFVTGATAEEGQKVRIIEQVLIRARVALAIGVAVLRHATSALFYRAGEWTGPRLRRHRP
jgi:hypothetical protein